MADALALTEQLRRFSQGDGALAEAILREVLPKLHEIAVRELRRERYLRPLDPTELINEVWLRNLGRGGWQIASRGHFYAIAALAMRRVLVDFARMRLASSRGNGSEPLTLEDTCIREAISGASPEEVVELGILMERLEKIHPEAARIVDLHHFIGFTLEEICDITGLTFRQVRHRWEKGRNWLKSRL